MHQHIETILLAIVAGAVALIVTQCGASDTIDEEASEAATEILTPMETSTTTTILPATTTTAAPTDTLPVSVAPVLATDDPETIAYCLATSMVSDVLVTGVRGDIDAVRRAIDRRANVIRSVVPPEEIASDIETVLVTSRLITSMLADDGLHLTDKRDTLAVMVSDEEFRASVAAVARFEAESCTASTEDIEELVGTEPAD